MLAQMLRFPEVAPIMHPLRIACGWRGEGLVLVAVLAAFPAALPPVEHLIAAGAADLPIFLPLGLLVSDHQLLASFLRAR
jgi:hypothetical protein